jgi:hypothetical protein
MIAVGIPGSMDDLPQNIQDREVPSQRENVSQIITKGKIYFKD